jgi:hypothetical protein
LGGWRGRSLCLLDSLSLASLRRLWRDSFVRTYNERSMRVRCRGGLSLSTVETNITVGSDGTAFLTPDLLVGIPPEEHRAVVFIEEPDGTERSDNSAAKRKITLIEARKMALEILHEVERAREQAVAEEAAKGIDWGEES